MRAVDAHRPPGLARRIAFLALTLFVFSQPWEAGVPSLGGGSISRIMGVVALMLGLLAVINGRGLKLRPISLFLALAIAFTTFGGISTFWSIQPMVSVVSTVKYVQLLAMVWLIHEFARDRRDRDTLMQAYVFGGLVSAGFAVWTFFTVSGFRDVATGNANDVAMYLAIGIPMAAALMFRTPNRALRIVNFLYLPAALVVDFLAASRGGLLAALVGLLAIPILLTNVRPMRRLLIGLALVAVGWSIYGLAPRAFPELQANLERLGQTTQELESGTLTYRRLIWDAGLKVFRDQPVVGVGLGGYRYAIEPYYGIATASHNSFLSVLVDLGITGFALWAIMIAVAIVPGLTVPGNQRWFNGVFALTLLVGIAPLEVEDRKQVWFVLSMLAMERSILLARFLPTALPRASMKAVSAASSTTHTAKYDSGSGPTG